MIDVARVLFGKFGVENTTMNDIADASGKSRRTLYTYFKSRDDVYLAVIETELDKLYQAMTKVIQKNISPEEKIVELIYTRLGAVKEVVIRNGTLQANFFRDIWRVEKVRRRFDALEIDMFKSVLEEGAKSGIFEVDDLDMTARILHYCLKGVEVPYIRGQIGTNLPSAIRAQYVGKILFGALHCTKSSH